MKTLVLTLSCSVLLPGMAYAELLFSDSFDVADNTSFDAADTTGRLSGTLAADTVLRTHKEQQQILGNQMYTIRGGTAAGVRFENAPPSGATNRYDWAAGAAGSAILAAGGVNVSFDWTPPDNTGTQWVSWVVGTPNADSGSSVVNAPDNDYGILFRNNGGTQRFDNGDPLPGGGGFTTTAGGATTYQVSIDYAFTSFADGTDVTATASVDGAQVASDTFQWDGNAGEIRMEFASNLDGNLVDNLTISTPEVAGFVVDLDSAPFLSSLTTGDPVGTVSAAFDGVPEAATFTLVAGAGDADNGKFQIFGDELRIGASFDFLDEPNGTTYSVRVRGEGISGSGENEFMLTLIADADSDTLPDPWELAVTDTGGGGNLTDLNGAASGPGPGAGTGDFDGDLLTDLQEFDLSQTMYSTLSPVDDDSDGDTLLDGAEIAGAGDRPPTDPTDADSDDDALTDGQESNTMIFVNIDDTGSNPLLPESDTDGFRDYFEALRGGDPSSPVSLPPLDPAVQLMILTDDTSSGVDPAKTYTHTISGGGAATINGVAFDDFGPAVTPVNFAWDAGVELKSQIAAVNNGDWDPVAGGVTGAGLLELFGGFTYSGGSGSNPGSFQTFTLSGLTPGESYTLTLYVRIWDTEAAGRPSDLSFTNGATVSYAPLLEDRPATMLGGGATDQSAYAIKFSYTAVGSDLVVGAVVPLGGEVPSGSFHMYGLTNEVAPGGGSPFAITEFLYEPGTGQVNLTFRSVPGRDYTVYGSADFATWITLFDSDNATSDETEVDFLLGTFFPQSLPTTYGFRIGEKAPGGDD